MGERDYPGEGGGNYYIEKNIPWPYYLTKDTYLCFIYFWKNGGNMGWGKGNCFGGGGIVKT